MGAGGGCIELEPSPAAAGVPVVKIVLVECVGVVAEGGGLRYVVSVLPAIAALMIPAAGNRPDRAGVGGSG